jgi:hypothetical protein
MDNIIHLPVSVASDDGHKADSPSPNSKQRLHWFQWCPERFAMEVMGWRPLSRLIYRELLDYQWTQSHLPDDLHHLQRIVGLTAKEWRKHWPTVERKFPIGKDSFRRNPDLEQLRQESLDISDKRKESGRQGGLAKAAKKLASAKQVPEGAASNCLHITEHIQNRTGHVGAGGASVHQSESDNPDSSGSPYGSGYPPRPFDDGAIWDRIEASGRHEE